MADPTQLFYGLALVLEPQPEGCKNGVHERGAGPIHCVIRTGTRSATGSVAVRRMTYPFKFDIGKTIQAVGVLLEPEHGRRMAYIRVLKLLYIADRESLKETHRPITGDNPIAMRNGPLPEGTYKLIRGMHFSFPAWSKHFQKEHYQLAMLESPGVDRLAPYEIEKLQDVARRYEELDDWELVDLVHEFDEWKKNQQGNSSAQIPLEDILSGVGCPEALADALAEAADDEAADRLFGSLTP